jgi:anti-sigma factor RsiW
VSRDPVSANPRGPALGARVRFAVDHRWAQRRISQQLDGELDGGAHRRMLRHESACPECRELLASLRRLLNLLDTAATRDQEPAPALVGIVSARLHEPA